MLLLILNVLVIVLGVSRVFLRVAGRTRMQRPDKRSVTMLGHALEPSGGVDQKLGSWQFDCPAA